MYYNVKLKFGTKGGGYGGGGAGERKMLTTFKLYCSNTICGTLLDLSPEYTTLDDNIKRN